MVMTHCLIGKKVEKIHISFSQNVFIAWSRVRMEGSCKKRP